MKKLVALIKTDLRIQKNILFFKKENEKVWTIIKSIFLIMLFYLAVDYQVVNIFSVLKGSNQQEKIFTVLLEVQFLILLFTTIRSIMNNVFLSSDWRETYIYPIRAEKILLSKCIVLYINNLILAAMFLVFLFTYGILNGEAAIFYIKVIVYQLFVSAVPIIYLTLISITLLYLIGLIKKGIRHKISDAFIIVLDVMVGWLTYVICIEASSDSNFVFDVLVNDSLQIVLFISVVFIFIASIYLTCGRLYLSIMKSSILKSSGRGKGEITFKKHNKVISSMKRDMKLLGRVSLVRNNCVVVNQIYNLLILVAIFALKDNLRADGIEYEFWIKIVFFVFAVWYATFINWIPSMAFERETVNLKELKVFPIEPKQFLLSKIILSMLGNVLSFINLNLVIILLSNDIVEFLLYEVMMIVWMAAIMFINIDYSNYNSETVSYEEVFEIGRGFKKLKAFNIFIVFWIAYSIINIIISKKVGIVLMNNINYIVFLMLGIGVLALGIRKLKKVF